MNESVNSSHHKKKCRKFLRKLLHKKTATSMLFFEEVTVGRSAPEGELIAHNIFVISGIVRMWTIQNQFIYCLLCSYCCLLMSKEEFGKYLMKVF